ncbi:MAG: helix-turn-helix domain-containing protein [Acidobacteriota bacterium]
MGRSLKICKPRKSQVRQLHLLLEEELAGWQRRRAEAILLYAGGLNASEIARLLEVHVNTIYSDLQSFGKDGVNAVKQRLKVGKPADITDQQITEILQLAKKTPIEIGLAYGRWSLSKLRDYLIKQRMVKKISRMHLGRLLKKGIATSAS